MQRALLAAIALLLTAGASPEDPRHEMLMDQIEDQVRLPTEAPPLGDYARYYADGNDGEVLGVYIIPLNYELRPGESCSELDQNFQMREVPCPPMRPPWAMPAGKRRWLKDQTELPIIHDGGCVQVTVIFDKARSVVKSVECNGRS